MHNETHRALLRYNISAFFRSLLAVENVGAEHGRGIYLMKMAMDEVSFERGGTEVHIRKESGNEKTHTQCMQNEVTT